MSTTHPDQNQHALQTYLQQRRDPAWYLDVNDPELKNISSVLAGSMDSADITTLLQLASAYIDAGQEKKIIALCEHKYEQDENLKGLLSRIAYHESLRGNDEIATRLYRMDLKKNKTSAGYKRLLALEEAKLENWSEAERLVDHACKESQDPWIFAGHTFLGIEKIIQSNNIEYAEKKINASSACNVRLMALCTFVKEGPNKTSTFIENFYQKNTTQEELYNFIGWHLAWLGEITEGNKFMDLERKFKQGKTSSPQNHIVTLGILGKTDQALEMLDEIPGNDRAQLRIGLSYYKAKSIIKKNLRDLIVNKNTNKLLALTN